jgi:hypothetical protein
MCALNVNYMYFQWWYECFCITCHAAGKDSRLNATVNIIACTISRKQGWQNFLEQNG